MKLALLWGISLEYLIYSRSYSTNEHFTPATVRVVYFFSININSENGSNKISAYPEKKE